MYILERIKSEKKRNREGKESRKNSVMAKILLSFFIMYYSKISLSISIFNITMQYKYSLASLEFLNR